MTIALQNTPIKQRFRLAILLASLGVLAVTSAAFTLYEFVAGRQELARNLAVTAKLVSASTRPALEKGRTQDAQAILGSVGAARHIVAAAVYDRHGRLVAGYPSNAARFPKMSPQGKPPFPARELIWSEPICSEQQQIGTLVLQASLAPISDRLRACLPIAGAVMAASVMLALLLSESLQRSIAPPVLELVETARAIAERRDYSVRARKFADDELGMLTDSFNHMLHEIQSRAQRDALTAAIVESSDDAIIGKDLEGNIISWNSGAERMFGYTAEEMVGQSVLKLICPDRPDEERTILERIRRGERVEHYETVRIAKSGAALAVSLSMSPIRDAQGDVAGVSSIMRNITERRRAEAEIRRLNTELEERVRERTARLTEANRELEAFSYSVSHDLRAPLRHVDAFARILSEELGAQSNPDELQDYAQRIRKGTETMGRLIDDLLKLSRVGRAPVAVQTVDLNPLVQEVISELNSETGSRQVEWSVGPLPHLACDPGLMRVVFVNFLSNALKYTRRRSKAVIEVGETEAGKERAIFVRDNGVGFSMQYAHKLFGVFERLHRAEEFEGTGIGLATVRRIIQKHGGRVWAEGTPDRGATFYFTIPDAFSHCTRPDSASKIET